MIFHRRHFFQSRKHGHCHALRRAATVSTVHAQRRSVGQRGLAARCKMGQDCQGRRGAKALRKMVGESRGDTSKWLALLDPHNGYRPKVSLWRLPRDGIVPLTRWPAYPMLRYHASGSVSCCAGRRAMQGHWGCHSRVSSRCDRACWRQAACLLPRGRISATVVRVRVSC
jgi:hypothetical protein